jgi:hypothetical protein
MDLSMSAMNWADMVEGAVSSALAAAPTKTELELLADSSRDGINLMFKQVGSDAG